MENIRKLTKDQWNREFNWYRNIWTSDTLKEIHHSKNLGKFKCWSCVSLDDGDYLIPGIHKGGYFIYVTKQIIDYNVIVKL